MHVEDGRVLTSVFAESQNGAAGLCHETGTIYEAHKLNLAVIASVCVSRETERDPSGIAYRSGANLFAFRGALVGQISPFKVSRPHFRRE